MQPRPVNVSAYLLKTSFDRVSKRFTRPSSSHVPSPSTLDTLSTTSNSMGLICSCAHTGGRLFLLGLCVVHRIQRVWSLLSVVVLGKHWQGGCAGRNCSTLRQMQGTYDGLSVDNHSFYTDPAPDPMSCTWFFCWSRRPIHDFAFFLRSVAYWSIVSPGC